jgi:hypothetical protein
LFGWFALETGYTTEEVKAGIIQNIVNQIRFMKVSLATSSQLSAGGARIQHSEMTLCIDRFRDYASKKREFICHSPVI